MTDQIKEEDGEAGKYVGSKSNNAGTEHDEAETDELEASDTSESEFAHDTAINNPESDEDNADSKK